MTAERDDRVGAWRALLFAHAEVVRTIDGDLRRVGAIPLGWYDVLLELNSAPERRLRMNDLAARAVLSRSRISRIVDELVGAGLVERQPHAGDGRGAVAAMTAQGRAAFKQAAPQYLGAIERHFTGLLTPDEQRVISGALARVAAHHRQPEADAARRPLR